tara:strand:- start:1587 stop:1751 length:165 start_codon:yes stop_codon:yes gene_type:complete
MPKHATIKEIDGQWHVIGKSGQFAGKTVVIRDTEQEAINWAKKRDDKWRELGRW